MACDDMRNDKETMKKLARYSPITILKSAGSRFASHSDLSSGSKMRYFSL